VWLRFWWWLLRLFGRYPPPDRVETFTGEIVMARNVRLSWQLPTQREDGSALLPADIAGVRIGVKVDGNPGAFADLGIAPASQLDLLVPDLEPGIWHFQATAIDRQVPPKESAPAVTSVDVPVPVLAAPGAVVGFAAALE
jgi:hypothetical protein